MDPTKNYTYEVVENLFAEIVNVFPDAYFHIGGDEVNLECWYVSLYILCLLKKQH